MLQTIAAGLIMVGVLVVVHEAGHMLVAKLFRIGVPVFSIGMGPRLFGFRWKGTDYRVSALPVGGYVRMAGADPFGEEEVDESVPDEQNFMKKPVWQRLLVMFAGPAANLILPFVLFAGALMLGEPKADSTVGYVLPGRAAEELGFEVGDRFVEAAGREIDVFADFVWVLDHHPAENISVVVERSGEQVELSLPPEAVPRDHEGVANLDAFGLAHVRLSSRIGVDDPSSPAARAGLRTGDAIVAVNGAELETWEALLVELENPGPHAITYVRPVEGELKRYDTTLMADPAWQPREGEVLTNPYGLVHVQVFVASVAEDSAAVEAGIQPSDRIWSIDGQIVRSWNDLIGMVGATVENAGPDATPRPLELGLIRDGELVELAFRPRMKRELVPPEVRYRPLIGISRYDEAFVAGPVVDKYYGPLEAIPRAWSQGAEVFQGTLTMLGNLLTGEAYFSESVGGPVAIFSVAGQAAEAGAFIFARVMGHISFSLAIVNLLPVPVLDGGQIVFYAIEGLRGRPLPLELRERVQMVGVLALVALMLAVTVLDVSDLLGD